MNILMLKWNWEMEKKIFCSKYWCAKIGIWANSPLCCLGGSSFLPCLEICAAPPGPVPISFPRPNITAFIFPHDQMLHLEFTTMYMIISTGNGGMMRSTTPLLGKTNLLPCHLRSTSHVSKETLVHLSSLKRDTRKKN